MPRQPQTESTFYPASLEQDLDQAANEGTCKVPDEFSDVPDAVFNGLILEASQIARAESINGVVSGLVDAQAAKHAEWQSMQRQAELCRDEEVRERVRQIYLPGMQIALNNRRIAPNNNGVAPGLEGLGAGLFSCHNRSLWYDLDFITAHAASHVEDAEARAVDLLRQICDRERYDRYLQTGHLVCLGNLTHRLYVVRRRQRAEEYVDGEKIGEWCIHIQHASGPPTDNVIALKNLIEGEEQLFRGIGNFSSFDLASPVEKLLQSSDPKLAENQFVEFDDPSVEYNSSENLEILAQEPF